jgi:hypothetical protein
LWFCQQIAVADLACAQPGAVAKRCGEQVPQMCVGEQDERLLWLHVPYDVIGGPGRPISDDVSDVRVLPGGDDAVRCGVIAGGRVPGLGAGQAAVVPASPIAERDRAPAARTREIRRSGW